MKKLLVSLALVAIVTGTCSNVNAIYTWTGPIVDGKKTTCLESNLSMGDISASSFKSVTNLSSSVCQRLSSTHYNQVLHGKYFYMYSQYWYNTTVNSVLNTNYGTNGIFLSNSGG